MPSWQTAGSSMPPQRNQNELIEQTRDYWQRRTPKKLTSEDARQITENLTGFFRVLVEWEAAERRPPNPAAEIEDTEPPRGGGGPA